MDPVLAVKEVDRIMKIVDKNESGEVDYSGIIQFKIKRMDNGNNRLKKFAIERNIRINIQNV